MTAEKIKKTLLALNEPTVWIPLGCAVCALIGQELARGVALLLSALLLCALTVATALLRRGGVAGLSAQEKAFPPEQIAACVIGLSSLVLGAIALTTGNATVALTRDITAGIGLAVSFYHAEHRLEADCLALNISMLRGAELLEQGDEPYPLGNADIAVIDPDIFSRAGLLPPKFFYAGALRHMGAMDSRAQCFLMQAVIGCTEEGTESIFSELRVKNTENEKLFTVVNCTEEKGLSISRQFYRGAPVTFIKGDTEALIRKCEAVMYANVARPMTEEELSAIRTARAAIRDRGCRVYAYAMHTEKVRAPVFLGLVGFGITRETDLPRTVSSLREAGVDICFAGTGGRETIFGVAEHCGLSVTRFMTGRELSGRCVPPTQHEIASHRLFAEITPVDRRVIIAALQHEGYHPVVLGHREIAGDGGSVRAGFSGRESCEKLLLCIKLRRSAVRAARGFGAMRRALVLAALLWPAIAGIIAGCFICPLNPTVIAAAGLFSWLTAFCTSLMFKHSETPRDLGAERRSGRGILFSDVLWITTLLAASAPLVCVPLMYPEQETLSLALGAAALLLSCPLLVFGAACGIGLHPLGVFRKHPASYVSLAAAFFLALFLFSYGPAATALGYFAVPLSAWRMCIPFALIPLIVLGIFLFVEYYGRDPGGYSR